EHGHGARGSIRLELPGVDEAPRIAGQVGSKTFECGVQMRRQVLVRSFYDLKERRNPWLETRCDPSERSLLSELYLQHRNVMVGAERHRSARSEGGHSANGSTSLARLLKYEFRADRGSALPAEKHTPIAVSTCDSGVTRRRSTSHPRRSPSASSTASRQMIL